MHRLDLKRTPSPSCCFFLVSNLRRQTLGGFHGPLQHRYDVSLVLDAATKHRDLANALIEQLKTQVWLVPTHYAGTTSSPYLEQLFDGLHQDVLVMWTGEHVVEFFRRGAPSAQALLLCGEAAIPIS